MRKKLSLLLALVLCLVLVPKANASSSPFNDVPTSHWAYDAIVEAYNDGVMTGTAPGVFNPSGKLNMGQFTTILARAFYADELEPLGADEYWWEPAYKIAYYSNHNLFGENHNIAGNAETTREVMAEMMYRVMVDKGAIFPNDTEIQMTMNKIPDFSVVDSNFQTGVAVCYSLELLSGVDPSGTFAPKGVLNRAQTAVIYTRLKRAISVLGTGTPGTKNPGTTDPGTIQNPTGATLTNGMPVTEENVLALIEEYRNGKEPGEKAKAAGFTSYMQGSTYDAYNPPYSLSLFGSGTECAKFAFAFWDDIFGTDAPIREVTDHADVRPGDLIRYSSHWAIATTHAQDYKGRGPHVQEVGGGPAGSIGWSSGTYSNISADSIKLYTRYPE